MSDFILMYMSYVPGGVPGKPYSESADWCDRHQSSRRVACDMYVRLSERMFGEGLLYDRTPECEGECCDMYLVMCSDSLDRRE